MFSGMLTDNAVKKRYVVNSTARSAHRAHVARPMQSTYSISNCICCFGIWIGREIFEHVFGHAHGQCSEEEV